MSHVMYTVVSIEGRMRRELYLRDVYHTVISDGAFVEGKTDNGETISIQYSEAITYFSIWKDKKMQATDSGTLDEVFQSLRFELN